MADKNFKKGKGRQKEQKEFAEEVLQIARVTRVVKGGRRLRFRVTIAIGDRKGRVGIGVGKATEVVSGIKKAVSRAKRDLITIPITDGGTIPHEVKIKFKASRLIFLPAAPGTGVIAGGAIRKILALAGVKNVLSKNIGTRNTLVTAQATLKALQELRPLKKSFKKIEVAKVEPKVEEKAKTVEKVIEKKTEEKAKTVENVSDKKTEEKK